MKKMLYFILILLSVYVPSRSQSVIKEGSHSYACSSTDLGNIIPAHYDSICISLNLPMVDNIRDSFMLSLWTSSMAGYGVMILRIINGKWEAHQYKYLGPTTLQAKPLHTCISTDSLLIGLRQIDFKNLRQQYQIPGFRDNVYDGTTYTLEAVYKDSFKIVTYHSPEASEDTDNRTFRDVLKLLNQFFRIY